MIEPFEGAVRTGILFSQLLEPVHPAVEGRLPGPAWYWLSLPLDPSLGVRDRELSSLQRALSDWILSEAGPLYQRSLAVLERDSFPRDFQASVEADLPGFPYPVKLSCDARGLRVRRKEGQLFPARIAPEDDELARERTKRVRRTLSDKCPKLNRCRDEGARTVLVLETDDIALSNRLLVRDALAGPLSERADAPDEVYLVETDTNQWMVYPMRLDGRTVVDGDPDTMFEFRKDELTDLADVG